MIPSSCLLLISPILSKTLILVLCLCYLFFGVRWAYVNDRSQIISWCQSLSKIVYDQKNISSPPVFNDLYPTVLIFFQFFIIFMCGGLKSQGCADLLVKSSESIFWPPVEAFSFRIAIKENCKPRSLIQATVPAIALESWALPQKISANASRIANQDFLVCGVWTRSHPIFDVALRT